jgi:hypothetical protein
MEAKPRVLEGIFRNIYPDDLKHPKFDIPFIRDLEGNSIMHLLMKKEDYKTSNLMLSVLQGFSMDHHSKQMFDIIP